MNTASEILLIIVSSVLSLFLLVGIIALVKFIQILSTLKRIAQKAEHLTESAEAVGDFFRKSASKVAFGGFLSNIVNSVIKHKKD